MFSSYFSRLRSLPGGRLSCLERRPRTPRGQQGHDPRSSARRRELGNCRERSPPSNRRPAGEMRRRAQHSGSRLSRSLNPRNVRVAQGRSTRAQPRRDTFPRHRTCHLSGRLAWQTAHVHNQRPGCIPDRSRTNTRHFRSISHSPAASRRELSGCSGRPTRRVARR
jgi:hypothetical protein